MTIKDIQNYFLMEVHETPYTYKDLKIGDPLMLPDDDYRLQDMFENKVVVTGFNPPYDIVHWTAPTIYGGMSITGSKYKELRRYS